MYWIVAGLASDLVGVALLGVDLVRVQRALRGQAAEAEAKLQALEDEWGNTSEELDRLSKEADKWYTPPSSYGDGEERYNAQALRSAVTEIAGVAGVTAGHFESVAKALRVTATRERLLSTGSLRFSYAGVVLLVAGFILQIVGAWLV